MQIRSSISLGFLVLSLSACGSSSDDPSGGVDGGAEPGDAAPATADARVVTGPCATLVEGRNSGFPAGGFERDFILTLPTGVDDSDSWPVVFNWHGLGDSAQNMSGLVAGLVNRPEFRFIAVTPEDTNFVLEIPFAGGQNMDWEIFQVNDSNRELALYDAVLACIDERWGVDRDQVHSMGFSLGGIVTDMLGTMRGDELASIATYSGGYWSNPDNVDVMLNQVVSWPEYQVTNKYAQLFLHGGTSDLYDVSVTQLHFDQYAVADAQMLNDQGHDAVVCNHNGGHRAPAPGMSGDRVIDFFAAHPRGLATSPYASSGLPEDFADYCNFSGKN